MTNPTPQEILALPLSSTQLPQANTVGQYLMGTLRKFIHIQDAFNSKRPFGDSDWEIPLIWAFADANLIWLRTDENSLIDDYPTDKFWNIVNDLADFLVNADYSTLQLPPPPPEPKEWYLVFVASQDGKMEDCFMEPMTEDEAKTKADENNKPYGSNPWRVIHIPSVS